MLLFVLYSCLRLFIDLALAPVRDRAADQAEPLVLRHQIRVLESHVKVVHWRPADRLYSGALAPKALLVHAAGQAANGVPLVPRAGPKEVGDLRTSSSPRSRSAKAAGS